MLLCGSDHEERADTLTPYVLSVGRAPANAGRAQGARAGDDEDEPLQDDAMPMVDADWSVSGDAALFIDQ